MFNEKEVIEANIELHTAMADSYKELNPHYKAENIERVDKILKSIKDNTKGEKLLDVGCGMGFIIDIAKKYFNFIRGIDITPAMIDKFNISDNSSDIKVELAKSDDIPYEDNTYDVCTAHAVLHHLYDVEPTFKEIYRVLKPGGVFYSDLDPNFYFWKYISELPTECEYNDIISREINGIKFKDVEFKDFNVSKELLHKAENYTHIQGGFKEEELIEKLKNIGFSNVEIKYEWFLSEWKYVNQDTKKYDLRAIKEYLHEILPVSRHLFKYISIYAVK